jgi:hypothetical protein
MSERRELMCDCELRPKAVLIPAPTKEVQG